MVSGAKNLLLPLLLLSLVILESRGHEVSESREKNQESSCDARVYDDIMEPVGDVTDFVFYPENVTLLLSGVNPSLPEERDFLLIHVPEKSEFREDDIRRLYRRVYLSLSFNYVRVVVHARSIEKIAEIFRDLTIVFHDLSIFHDSLMVVLLNDSGMSDNTDETETRIILALENVANMSKRGDVERLVQTISSNRNKRIAILNDASLSELPLVLLDYAYVGGKNIDSLFGHYILESMKCSKATLKKTILSDQNNIVKRYENAISKYMDEPIPHESELQDAIAEKYNEIWRLSKGFPETFDSEDIMDMLRETYGIFYVQVENRILTGRKAWKILFDAVSDEEFRQTVREWYRQFDQLDLKIPENLTRWYGEREGGKLLRKDMNYCATDLSGKIGIELKNDTVVLSEYHFHKCQKNKHLEYITIFAYERVVIDVDLIFIGGEMQVTIMAPVWEIVGNRTINLSGANGKDPGEPQARNGSVHEQRRVDEHVAPSSTDGMDGKDGSAGGPAGTFYGIAGTIINAQNLTIIANGGDGTSGQDGGHGVRDASRKTYNGVPKFDCKTGNMTEKSDWEFIDAGKNCNNPTGEGSGVKSGKCYIVRGKKAIRGGMGGSGGIGGEGGRGGYIIVHEVSKQDSFNSLIKFSSEDGRTGVVGFGGNPGDGAQHGYDVEIHCPRGSGNNQVILVERNSENPGFSRGGTPGKSGLKIESTREQRLVQNFPWIGYVYFKSARSRIVELGSNRSKSLSAFYHSLNTWKYRFMWDTTLYSVLDFTNLERNALHSSYDPYTSYDHLLFAEIIKLNIRKFFREAEFGEHIPIMRHLLRNALDRVREIRAGEESSFLGTLQRGFFDLILRLKYKYSDAFMQVKHMDTMNNKALRTALERLDDTLKKK